jgi:membrane-associated phospholipid phosphatase
VPVALAASVALVGILALHTAAGRSVDRHVFFAFVAHRSDDLVRLFIKGTHLGDPGPFAALAAAVVVIALVAGGLRLAALVLGVLLLANLTTLVLNHTVSVARVPFDDPELWPSNHATAVAAAGLCLPLIARGRLQLPAALLAFGMTAGIALMLVARGTHLLSDVVAAQLVAGFWAVLAAQSGSRLKIGRGRSLMASITQRRKPGT